MTGAQHDPEDPVCLSQWSPMSTIDHTPAEMNVVVRRGDSWVEQWTFVMDGVPLDVSAWEFAAQVREYEEADDATDIEVDTADAVNGNVYTTLTDVQCAALPESNVWDFEWVIAGNRRTYFAGSFTAEKDVTREAGS